MCGIFGVINLNSQPADGLRGTVENGIRLLRHRGPDEQGIESRGGVCFGHARLSIIDLESGHQPMSNYDKSGLIVYNGEVYNFPEIRSILEKRGYTFLTRSDTEVVLNAYLEWGPGCLSHFRGMFAFAAVDFKKRRVLLARDRLGKKPLFYTEKDNRLYFSSELEPLYKTIGPFKIDLESMDDYLNWQYIHAPKTIYQGVHALRPAHYIEIDLVSGKMSHERYWKLVFKENRSFSIEDWEHKLDELLRESVRIRLRSDVPFGVFLSGGIDSSLVTSYMAEILDEPVKTFSIGFKETDFSELEYAEKVAKLNKTEHYTEIVEAESLALLPLLVRHYGQPFADSSAIPTYYVARMARKHVKMALSGDGGDENFAGYNSYEYIMRALEGGPACDASSGIKRRLYDVGRYYYLLFKRLAVINSPVDSAYELHCHTAKHFSPYERRKLFKEEYEGVVQDNAPYRKALMNIGNQPMISRLQHLDLMAYLPFDILTKVDIASMANSLEVRTPFLDHVLVETAATIPAEFKLKEEKINKTVSYDKKYILKRIARKRYPSDIIDRKKMGFGVPLGIWFATKLKEDVRKKLMESEYLPGFFNMDEIGRIVNAHSLDHNYSTSLWNLLFLEEWMNSHRGSMPAGAK